MNSIKGARHIALFLDYDGTLTQIVERPEDATLPDKIRDILKKISKDHRFTLGIISGRSLKDIKRLVVIKDIYYVGNHGLEAIGPKFRYINPNATKTKRIIRDIHKKLLIGVKSIKGVIIENKGLTETLHYRMVQNKDIPKLRKIFIRTVDSYLSGGKIKISENKKTLEVLPDTDWDKGKIVLKILDKISILVKENILPIYIGDDRTDEDAFRGLRNIGISVLVSENPKKSNAKYYLKDVKDVVRFLRLLLD